MLDSIKLAVEDLLGHDTLAADSTLLLGIAIVSILSYYLTKAILWSLEKAIQRSPTHWDDDIFNRRFNRGVSQLAPALMVSWLLPRLFGDNGDSVHWLDVVTSFYILWAVIHIIVIFIDNLYNGLYQRENTRPYAIKGVFQMFKLIFWGIGVIVGLSMLIGKTPLAILGALGASAAVLMLVFKDTILGLVASVQLTANKMVHRGDWIVCDSHQANGVVEDISLTTVKVRNWDNSVTTIPPYSLVSESFRNYQSMVTSGGRRVMRSVYIDANTVRRLSAEEFAAAEAEGLVAAGLESMVNLELLRICLERELAADPRVNAAFTLMVRQLDPTPSGLPLELYFFTRTTAWVEYEHIQSEIFARLYAVLPRFGLRVFQTPAESDISALRPESEPSDASQC